MDKKHILVVGGGITGLTSAYYLQKEIKEKNLPYSITLIEKSDRLGGKISTEVLDGFVIEKGPDSFLARKQAIIDLSLELGLEDQLVGTNPRARKNYILYRNKLHIMPPGLILGIPTKLGPFIKTGLISPLGKLRAAMDLVIPAKKEEDDESLGGFLQRRLGKEVAENIAEPLLSGIYAGDTQNLSLNATFPQFKAVERKYGSIVKGMIGSRKAGMGARQPQLNVPPVAKQSMFLTFKNGLQTLVERLVNSLDLVQIEKNQAIKDFFLDEHGYRIILHDKRELKADAIILATPTYATKELLKDLDTASLLEEITYVSVANVVLGYRREDLEYPLDASGFVVPRKEGRNITACTWTSSKWLHTSPEDQVLFRCYIGNSHEQDLVDLPDEELVKVVQKDLLSIMGVKATPLFRRVTKWIDAMPQYRVGHLERLNKLRKELESMRPGLFLAGSGYFGVGIPDCIQQGKDAANQLIRHLEK